MTKIIIELDRGEKLHQYCFW